MNNPVLKLEKISDKIYSTTLPDYQELNQKINTKFLTYKDNDKTRKSHLFEGRYENIYIPDNLIPEVKTVLSYTADCVKQITGHKPIHSGLWYNYMEPGHSTLPHTHDDADEVYSAVYYVRIFDKSGDLIISEINHDITITPKEGMLILFPPDLKHHVTRNNSVNSRLSLGINIGN